MRRSVALVSIGDVCTAVAIIVLFVTVEAPRRATAAGDERPLPVTTVNVSGASQSAGAVHALVREVGRPGLGQLRTVEHIEIDEEEMLEALAADVDDAGMYVIPRVRTSPVGEHAKLATVMALASDQTSRHGLLMQNREVGFVATQEGTTPLLIRTMRLARQGDAYTMRVSTTVTSAIERISGAPMPPGGFTVEQTLRLETLNGDLMRELARALFGAPEVTALDKCILDTSIEVAIGDGSTAMIGVHPDGVSAAEALAALGMCNTCMIDCLLCLEPAFVTCFIVSWLACLPLSCAAPPSCAASIACSLAGCAVCYLVQDECDDSVFEACTPAILWCTLYECLGKKPQILACDEQQCILAGRLGDGVCDAELDCPTWGCDAGDCQALCGPVDFLRIAPFTTTDQLPLDMGDCELGPSAEHEYEVIIPSSGLWTFRVCGGPIVMHLTTHRCDGPIAEVSQLEFEECATASAEFQVVLSPGTYFVTLEDAFGAPTYTLDVLYE